MLASRPDLHCMAIMTADKKDSESKCNRTVDGDEENWYKWSSTTTTLPLAKPKGFQYSYRKDAKQCDNVSYKMMRSNVFKKGHDMRD